MKRENDINIKTDYPLAVHTSLRIGGNAEYAGFPENKEELKELCRWAEEKKLQQKVLGFGTNLLIADEGYNGLIIFLKEMEEAKRFEWVKEGQYRAGAWLSLARINKELMKRNRRDMAELSTIPGSLGGALKMNAGCYGKEISDTLLSVSLLQGGEEREKGKEAFKFRYRGSDISSSDIILSALFESSEVFSADKREEIESNMYVLKERRKATQPLSSRNAGSVFKNPKGHSAGRLIEEAGLKGKRVGGAVVSEVHANFIVNEDNASARDVYRLITMVEREVKAQFGVRLEREIEIIGTIKA